MYVHVHVVLYSLVDTAPLSLRYGFTLMWDWGGTNLMHVDAGSTQST